MKWYIVIAVVWWPFLVWMFLSTIRRDFPMLPIDYPDCLMATFIATFGAALWPVVGIWFVLSYLVSLCVR